ncbi:MAG: hypothetical protein V9G19_14380 [Tetrasphaera sp.]
MRPHRVLAIATAVIFAAGCGGTANDPTSDGSASATSPRPSVTPPIKEIRASVEERCHFPFEGTIEGIRVDAESTLAIATVGTGPTVVVMLPQVRGGMCGAMPYARLLAEKGIAAAPMDLCADGDSSCGPTVSKDPAKQVGAAVTWAREKLGADRVVVMGASAGGSTALGVAQQAGADAVVDLSGPANWPGVPEAEEAAKATTIPLLIMCAEADQGSFPARLRQAVKGSPAKVKKYVAAAGGHGWTMLTRDATVESQPSMDGKIVLDWVLKPTS